MGIFDFFGDDPQPLSSSVTSSTPAFKLTGSATSNAGGTTSDSSLTRLGSDAQKAFSARFGRSLADIDTLRGGLKPGFSLLRNARVNKTRDEGRQIVGRLKEDGRRRRVLGSDFFNDSVTRAELAVQEAVAEQEAKSFLEELEGNMKLIEFEFAQIGAQLDREMQELQISSGLATAVQGIVSQNMIAAQERAAANAMGAGKFFGTALGTVGGSFFKRAGSEFGDAVFGPAGEAAAAGAVS